MDQYTADSTFHASRSVPHPSRERTGASPPNPNLCKLIKLGLQISSKSISKHEIVISIERGVIRYILDAGRRSSSTKNRTRIR
uniref:Uncharacterized protein n=1 Tax=Helianthus annuus TaxID=4232 RepID=A0A251TT55_HELAN